MAILIERSHSGKAGFGWTEDSFLTIQAWWLKGLEMSVWKPDFERTLDRNYLTETC